MEGHQGYGWSIERHGADAQGAWKAWNVEGVQCGTAERKGT